MYIHTYTHTHAYSIQRYIHTYIHGYICVYMYRRNTYVCTPRTSHLNLLSERQGSAGMETRPCTASTKNTFYREHILLAFVEAALAWRHALAPHLQRTHSIENTFYWPLWKQRWHGETPLHRVYRKHIL